MPKRTSESCLKPVIRGLPDTPSGKNPLLRAKQSRRRKGIVKR